MIILAKINETDDTTKRTKVWMELMKPKTKWRERERNKERKGEEKIKQKPEPKWNELLSHITQSPGAPIHMHMKK